MSDRGEQPVTVLMPEGVVDLLEAVEVDDRDRRGPTERPPADQLGLRTPVEEHAVG